MEKFEKPSALQSFLERTAKQKKSIGFVPTMGSLHSGHISLINKSKSENDITIVSIYVNPSQFNDEKDFLNYPVDLDEDMRLLKKINCDVLFVPNTKDMYKDGFDFITLELGNLDTILEAKERPGHFKGVIFIVNKLFKIIAPNRAYFGEKDYQQLLIIKKLGGRYFKQILIIACPTIRDQDGLAMSSRNNKLTKQQLNIAKKVFNLLQSAVQVIKKDGIQKAKISVNDFFCQNEQINLEYFEIIDEKKFSLIKEIKKDKRYRLMIAFKIGNVRLIDNLKLKQ